VLPEASLDISEAMPLLHSVGQSIDMARSKTRRSYTPHDHEFKIVPKENSRPYEVISLVLQCLSVALKTLRQFDEIHSIP